MHDCVSIVIFVINKFAHDEISIPLPLFPLQQHFPYVQLAPHLQQRN